MADPKIARLVCPLKGDEVIASEPATCAGCGAALMYDPKSAAGARKTCPGYTLEFVCQDCMETNPADLKAEDLQRIRNALRGTVVGVMAQLLPDDKLKELLVRGFARTRKQ